MQISGQTDILVPPAHALYALQSQAHLERFLLGTSGLLETGPGTYSFAIQRRLAVITLNLPGTLCVTETDPGRVCHFEAKAAHLIGGSAQLALDMTFDPTPRGTHLTWNGTLDSSGLARHVLREKESRIGSIVAQIMAEFKMRVQTEARLAAIVVKPANRG